MIYCCGILYRLISVIPSLHARAFLQNQSFYFSIFSSQQFETTILLQVCSSIKVKKLDKVLFFKVIILIANVEFFVLFRFLMLVTALLLNP